MNLFEGVKNNNLIALSIGLVYFWFGALKFFPGLSPAEDLAKNTIEVMTFGLIPSNISIVILAIWETAVGFLLILNVLRRQVVILALVHMACTFSPFFIFTDQTFTQFPFQFTIMGQYIFKNIILVSALVYLYRLEPRT